MISTEKELLDWAVKNVPQWPKEASRYDPKPAGFEWFSMMSGMPVKLGHMRKRMQVTESEWRNAGGGIE